MIFISRSVASQGVGQPATQSLLLPVLSQLQGWSNLQSSTGETAFKVLSSSHCTRQLTQDQRSGCYQSAAVPGHDCHARSSEFQYHHASKSITRGFAASAVPKDGEEPQQAPAPEQINSTSYQEGSNDSIQPQSNSASSYMKHQHLQESQQQDNEPAQGQTTSNCSTNPSHQQGQQSPSTPLSQDVVYYGPLASTHKLLKRISISNTAIAFAAAPAIIAWADVSYVSRVGLATSLVLFGILTTGALHWITQPYIHELRYTAATQSFEAKMTSLFGRTRIQHFKLEDVQPLPWNRPVATFMANNKFYYIDVYSFPDEELLRRLTPPEDTVPPGYKDDDD